jgi:hypothetical protein
MFKGIRVGALAKFAADIDTLLRGHFRPCERVGGVGFLQGIENLDRLLHYLIVSRCREDADQPSEKAFCFNDHRNMTMVISNNGDDQRREFQSDMPCAPR